MAIYPRVISSLVGVYVADRSAVSSFFETSPTRAITLPCGNTMVVTLATFPEEDFECRCGKIGYAHYFVRYFKEGVIGEDSTQD